ncbi:hypothetical protein MHB40_03055 [Lysinibacillus sp. FSL K6-0057]|uniref:hypothetical protein n=1 Tax=unclassified Lysinibacillus TaxID=2636778 RepID=UPI003158DAE8
MAIYYYNMGTDRIDYLLNKEETREVGGGVAEFAKKRLLYFCFFTIITKILRESLIFDNLVTIPENAWLLLRVRYNR